MAPPIFGAPPDAPPAGDLLRYLAGGAASPSQGMIHPSPYIDVEREHRNRMKDLAELGLSPFGPSREPPTHNYPDAALPGGGPGNRLLAALLGGVA